MLHRNYALIVPIITFATCLNRNPFCKNDFLDAIIQIWANTCNFFELIFALYLISRSDNKNKLLHEELAALSRGIERLREKEREYEVSFEFVYFTY